MGITYRLMSKALHYPRPANSHSDQKVCSCCGSYHFCSI